MPELTDKMARRKAIDAINDLLQVTGLAMKTGLVLPSVANEGNEKRLRLIMTLGRDLLGDDCPQQMEWC